MGAGRWDQGQLTMVQATMCRFKRLLTFGRYDGNGSNKDNPSKWVTLSALECESENRAKCEESGKKSRRKGRESEREELSVCECEGEGDGGASKTEGGTTRRTGAGDSTL